MNSNEKDSEMVKKLKAGMFLLSVKNVLLIADVCERELGCKSSPFQMSVLLLILINFCQRNCSYNGL